MSGSLTVACVQVNAGPEIEPNLRKVGDLILRTREAGADFITTPENVSVVNRDFQYVIQTGGFTAVAPAGYRCGPDALAALPSLSPLFARPEGTAHLLNGQLIALVRPSIIAN